MLSTMPWMTSRLTFIHCLSCLHWLHFLLFFPPCTNLTLLCLAYCFDSWTTLLMITCKAQSVGLNIVSRYSRVQKKSLCNMRTITHTKGVDFKVKKLQMAGKKIKATIWDTGLYIMHACGGTTLCDSASHALRCSRPRTIQDSYKFLLPQRASELPDELKTSSLVR